MSSQFGRKIKYQVFGQSHGEAVGIVIDGFPAGEKIDMDELNSFMARRRPGSSHLTTGRSEADKPVFLSGISENTTCGFPICAIIQNTDTRSGDYSEFTDKPRPGHADYTAAVKYGGHADMRGGGHFSGRLTAPLCIAGGIAKQILYRRGIYIGAHLYSIEKIHDIPYQAAELTPEMLKAGDFPVLSEKCGEKMKAAIASAASDRDSVGGVIECAVLGLPAGLGDPMFDGMESRISSAIFGIPAVKGIEFGSGFHGSGIRGSENNDPFIIKDGKVQTLSNNHGGILGGITSGMPLIFRAAFKPTPSISKKQNTVCLSKLEETELEIKGRHDPCVTLRAVPVLEAVTACVILDTIL